EWEVDFTSDPHLTFSSADGVVLRGRPHLIGSESSRDKTWLWGWENVNDFPDAVIGLSHDVRKFGAAEEVTELTTPELDRDEELALRLTLAAKEATGRWVHYPAEAGARTTVWLLLHPAEMVRPRPLPKVPLRPALLARAAQAPRWPHRLHGRRGPVMNRFSSPPRRRRRLRAPPRARSQGTGTRRCRSRQSPRAPRNRPFQVTQRHRVPQRAALIRRRAPSTKPRASRRPRMRIPSRPHRLRRKRRPRSRRRRGCSPSSSVADRSIPQHRGRCRCVGNGPCGRKGHGCQRPPGPHTV